MQSQKRLCHGLGKVFQKQGVEAAWTENQVGLLMQHMTQTANGPCNPQQVAKVLDSMLTAQTHTRENWHEAAGLCQDMQQTGDTASNEDAH